jgi:hypothetical protein
MPMGNGNLFLPVRAEIRKKIKNKPATQCMLFCMKIRNRWMYLKNCCCVYKMNPWHFEFFEKLSESEKKYYIQWIYSAKKEETKINRMAKAINRLQRGLKMYTPSEVAK